MTPNPNSNFGSKILPECAQFLKSRPRVILTSTELKFRSPPVISRGPNRYVGELRYNDPDRSPENCEEANYGSTEETLAKQPIAQSRSQCSPSEDHILIHEREWVDVTANMNTTMKIISWKPVSRNLSRTWCTILTSKNVKLIVHWKSMGPKLRHAFRKGRDTFSDIDWINHIWKGSSKTRIQY